MLAHAVPWPQTSPASSSSISGLPSASAVTTTALVTPPTEGWAASMPLSRMQTVTPAPVEPLQAHSRVTSAGQVCCATIPAAAVAGRLHAGSSSWITPRG